MIHILDRQTERILDVLVNQSDSKIYWDTKMTEAIEDNVLIFEFRMLADSPAAKHVVTKNKLTAQDQDGFHRLFIIDSVETSHDANGKILFVSALGDHIELASEEPIPPQTLNGQTAETAVQFVLANTRYQPGQIDFAGSRSITFDTYTDPLAALQKIASEFELELRFRVTVNPDGTITRIVDLLKPDDVFNGKEIVFGKDMTGILRKENTENICTRLIGIGPADEDGNIVTFASVNSGKIYVEDEEAFQRWNNAGRHIWGIFEYQPEEGTEVTPQQLLDATKKEMEKRKNSAVEWEVQAAALEQVIGLEHERVRVGMNVRIKDEAFDPPIYLEARVLETEMPELDDPNGNFSYTFGNYRQVTVIIPPEVKAIQKTLFRNANAWTAAKSIAAQALADAAKAQETADGKITSFYQPDPPVTASEGDLWFDTDDGNKPHIWQNGKWVNAQDSGIAEALNRANDAQATADKKVQTFFSETQPTAEGIGDLWYNPASGALFRWSGSAWELVSDVTGKNTAADTAKVNGKPAVQVIADITAAQQAVEEAKQTAQQAQTTADGKNSVFHSPTAPPTTGRKIGDVWFDTSRDNLMHVFNGTQWVEAKWGEQSIVANSITANHIKSLVGLNVNDQFIVDSQGNVKFAGELDGAGGVFSGEIRTTKLKIRAESIHDFGDFGFEIETAQWQPDPDEPFRRTGFINFNTRNDALEISRIDENGNFKQLAGFLIESKYNLFTGKVEIAPYEIGGSGDVLKLDGGEANHVYIEFYRSGPVNRSGYIGISDASSNYFTISSHGLSGGIRLTGGDVHITNRLINTPTYNNTTPNAANVYVFSNGVFARSTSSERYKQDIQYEDVDYKKILNLRQASWYDKGEVEQNGGSTEGLRRYYGAIAEDFERIGLSEYLVYNEQTGEIENFSDRAWVLLIPNINDILEELEQIKERLERLENEGNTI